MATQAFKKALKRTLLGTEFYRNTGYLLFFGLTIALLTRLLVNPIDLSPSDDIIIRVLGGFYTLAFFIVLGLYVNNARTQKAQYSGLRVILFSLVYGAVAGGTLYALGLLSVTAFTIGFPLVMIILSSGFFHGLVNNHSVWFSIEHTLSNLRSKIVNGFFTTLLLFIGLVPTFLGRMMVGPYAEITIVVNTTSYVLYMLLPHIIFTMVCGIIVHWHGAMIQGDTNE